MLWNSPLRLLRGEFVDERMLRRTYLNDAGILSYRHYQLFTDSEPAFDARVALAPRASIDNLSLVIRKVLARGRVGIDLRGGGGYDNERAADAVAGGPVVADRADLVQPHRTQLRHVARDRDRALGDVAHGVGDLSCGPLKIRPASGPLPARTIALEALAVAALALGVSALLAPADVGMGAHALRPHPIWLAVALMAARYGTRGLAAGLIGGWALTIAAATALRVPLAAIEARIGFGPGPGRAARA